MADRQSTKNVVQLDDAYSSSSSSSFSNSSDKSEIEFFPKPAPGDSSPFQAEDPTYDPTRIPPSVFSGRPSTCCDWSINSNESLFSIRMGNNSFSRDNAFIVYKSGELLRLDEVFSHPTLPPLAEAGGLGSKRPEFSVGTVGAAVPAFNYKAATVGEELDKKNDVYSFATSDGSDNSNCSFAFPILINNRAELRAELPSSHRVPTTSLKKTLAETLQQQQQPRGNPLKTPKPSGLSSWLSCSCCPFRRK